VSVLQAENPPGHVRASLTASSNNGFRGFQRPYVTCTTPAKTAADRFFSEGSQITAALTIALEAAAQLAAEEAAEAQPTPAPAE